MAQFLSTETLIIELLLIASLVAIAVRRLRIPYSVALVVVGLLLTTQSPVEIDLTPELILALFRAAVGLRSRLPPELQRAAHQSAGDLAAGGAGGDPDHADRGRDAGVGAGLWLCRWRWFSAR